MKKGILIAFFSLSLVSFFVQASPVRADNNGPSFIGFMPPSTATATVAYSYDVEATDGDVPADPLTFSLLSAPAGMIIDGGTGLISWLPSEADIASNPHLVTVQVQDTFPAEPNHVVTESFQITVGAVSTSTPSSTNLGPSFIGFVPPATATATVAYSYTAVATDPESDPLTFSLVTGPAGLTINASSGLISWTPDATQVSSTPYLVTVQVQDTYPLEPNHVVVENFQITVGAAPTTTTPTSTPPTTCTVNCGGGGGGSVVIVPSGCISNCGGGGGGGTPTPTNLPPYFVNFNPGTVVTLGQVYLYDVDGKDPENQPVTFSLLEGPSGLNILPNNGFIYWTPVDGQVRAEPYKVVLQISDGFLTATTSYAITVVRPPVVIIDTVPEPPVIVPPVIEPPVTPTTTIVTVVDTRGTLLASIIDWFRDNYCLLGYLLWLLTLLAWLAYLLLDHEDKDDEREEIAKELQVDSEAPVVSAESDVIPLFSHERETDESKEIV